jgi:hypothetical protein
MNISKNVILILVFTAFAVISIDDHPWVSVLDGVIIGFNLAGILRINALEKENGSKS